MTSFRSLPKSEAMEAPGPVEPPYDFRGSVAMLQFPHMTPGMLNNHNDG